MAKTPTTKHTGTCPACHNRVPVQKSLTGGWYALPHYEVRRVRCLSDALRVSTRTVRAAE